MSDRQSQLTNPRPLRIAHRGASAEKPENTLAAFHRALAHRSDGVELDVHVTCDGVPVVIHDATLRRLTGAPGRVAATPWYELRNRRVRGEPIPRLADVLARVRRRTIVQIEIKSATAVTPTVRAVRNARAERRVLFSSLAPGIVLAVRRLAPEIPRMLISTGRRAVSGLLRQLTALDAVGVCVHHHAVASADWVGRFHAHGFSVWCWTVNHPGAMRRLAEHGVDAIISDDPALLRRTLNSKSRTPKTSPR